MSEPRAKPAHRHRAKLAPAAAALALLCLLTPVSAHAGSSIGSREKIGLGVAAGSLGIGPSAKFYWAPKRAVQAVIGLDLDGPIALSVDAVWQFGPAMRDFPGRFFVDIGPGVGVLIKDDGIGGSVTSLALSLVAEVGFHFSVVPLEVVLGWRPTWRRSDSGRNLTPVQGAGGIRWYF